MNNLIKCFLFILFLANTIIAQSSDCRDITSQIKPILNSDKIHLMHAKVVGACIDNKNTLHLSLTTSLKYFITATGMGLSNIQTILMQTLVPFFSSATLIFKQLPQIDNYRIYFVELRDSIDFYGNKIGTQKHILCEIGLNRYTANKINWVFIKKNLEADIFSNNIDEIGKIIRMLDVYKLSK